MRSKEQNQKIMERARKSFVRQMDQSDCGVACLYSVIQYLGGDITMERLREMSGTNRQGTTMLGLYQSAEKAGLQADAYEADISNLKKIEQPCILHIIKNKKLKHFVVCYGYKNERFLISDPSDKVQWVNEDILDKEWQSRALLLLKPTDEFVTRKVKQQQRYNWIFNLVKDDVDILVVALALGIFITVLSLSTAIFSQTLIDNILPNRDTPKLFIGIGLLALLLLAQAGLGYVRQLFLIRQSRDFNNRVIQTFYSSLLYLPIPFFFNRKTGDLIARMNDTRRLQKTVTYLFADVMIDVLMIVVAGIFIFFHSMFLGFFIALSIPLFFVLTWLYHESILDGQKKVMAAHSANESNYVDTIQGIAAIKVANKEPFFSRLTKTIYGFFQDQIFDLGKIGIQFGYWANIIGVLFTAGVLFFGSMLVLSGEILIGALVAIFQMTSQLIPSVNRLALTNIQIQEARVAFDRMYEFTSLEPENIAVDNPVQVSSLDKLEVNNISFRFPGRSQLLKDLSFEVNRGEMIALLGESGCGKTTTLQILQGFYKPEKGMIKVNSSTSLNQIPVEDWRNRIASVSQNVKIFNGTLLDNICLGNSQEEGDKVIEFCRKLGFDGYFESFPQQYLCLLGEDGINISGGQQQLVALARALYQKPELLLLDEATSAMDRETEQKILQLLIRLKKNIMIVLITHRAQVAKAADRIYIIENGQITAEGNAVELSEKENLFSASLADLTI